MWAADRRTGDAHTYTCIHTHTIQFKFILKDRQCKERNIPISTCIYMNVRALGLSPSARAFSSEAISEAEAPSDRKDELAAVCVPWGCVAFGGCRVV